MKINHFLLANIVMVLTFSACGPDPCIGSACGDNSSASQQEQLSSSCDDLISLSSSSSSILQNSSSVVQSSSDTLPSNSSVAESSSSTLLSSSSIMPSSSSVSLCNGIPYNSTTQFCYNDSKVENKCGNRTEIFDPDLYKCVDDRGVSKIYLKTPVSYGSESYEAVLIGTQTWLARNLNYEPSIGNFYCYKYNDCDKYGRSYDWATAMDISLSCLNASCSYSLPRKGICPSGWHLPTKEEWEDLKNYIGSSGENKLRSASGWDWSATIGTDIYGFSAMAGGFCLGNGNCPNEGMNGNWWSSSEYSESSAYAWSIRSNGYVVSSGNNKSYGIYIRCVKD